MTLLKSQGTMWLGDHEAVERRLTGPSRNVCPVAASSTTEDARRVRQIIDAPHYVMSF